MIHNTAQSVFFCSHNLITKSLNATILIKAPYSRFLVHTNTYFFTKLIFKNSNILYFIICFFHLYHIINMFLCHKIIFKGMIVGICIMFHHMDIQRNHLKKKNIYFWGICVLFNLLLL